MFINTKYRSTRQEDMDDLSMEGDLLQNTLDQLVLINKRLGGNKATINGLHTLLKAEPKDDNIVRKYRNKIFTMFHHRIVGA